MDYQSVSISKSFRPTARFAHHPCLVGLDLRVSLHPSAHIHVLYIVMTSWLLFQSDYAFSDNLRADRKQVNIPIAKAIRNNLAIHYSY